MSQITRRKPAEQTPEEGPITSRVGQRPALQLGKLKELRAHELAVRFVSGAVISVCAGLIGYAITARVGGFLLAFPAILGASLTLIEEQEDSAEAREDARGAVLGGCAMAAFAGVAALTLGHLNSVLALALATVAWCVVALGGYLFVWYR